MEIWKKIDGYDNPYEISSLGRFKRTPTHITHGNENGFGKMIVCLRKNGKLKPFNVCFLVAYAFLGHSEFNFFETVVHKNGIKTDNRLENLELISRFELAKLDAADLSTVDSADILSVPIKIVK